MPRSVDRGLALLALVGLVIGSALPAYAGRVRGRDGGAYEGKVRIDSGGRLSVTPASGPAVTLPLSEIERAEFDPPPRPTTRPTSRPSTRPAGDSGNAGVARGWTGRDVGPFSQPGEVEITPEPAGDRMTIGETTSGLRLAVEGGSKKRKPDSFYFVSRPLQGDGAITARVRVVEDSRLARAGPMIRRRGDDDPVYVTLARTRDHKVLMLARTQEEEAAHPIVESDRRVLGALWLRIERNGNAFTSYESIDGKTWREIGQVTLPIPPDEPVDAGIAASGGVSRERGLAWTLVDRAAVSSTPAAASNRAPRGLVTTAGSFIAGDIVSADADAIAVASADGSRRTISAPAAARLYFVPLTPEQAAKLNAGAGVLLVNGDFVEGGLREFSADRLRLDSLVFGPRDFAPIKEAAAVALRPVQQAGRFALKLRDGSNIHVSSIEPEGDGYTVEAPAIGKLHIQRDQLSELHPLDPPKAPNPD